MAPADSMESQAGFYIHVVLDLFSVVFFGLRSGCVHLVSHSYCASLCFLISLKQLLLPKVRSIKPTSGADGWSFNPYFIDGQSLSLGVQSLPLHPGILTPELPASALLQPRPLGDTPSTVPGPPSPPTLASCFWNLEISLPSF